MSLNDRGLKISEIAEKLKVRVLNPGMQPEREIKGCYIGDLLSNVIARAKEGEIWLTVQTHQNVVAVAVLLNLGAILFVEGHQPQADTLSKAAGEGVCLLSTEKSAYEIVCALSSYHAGADVGGMSA